MRFTSARSSSGPSHGTLTLSRCPATLQTFSSSASYGGVNLIDQPPSFSELFGPTIVMDDPRHARLRRIVSRAFGPGLLRQVEVGGQRIREGEKVVMWYNSGNRDEAVFEDPYRFDVRRTPNEHVGFGGPGPHFCLGAHLARRGMAGGSQPR